VRHPIYSGVLLLALAWWLLSSPLALAPWSVAAVFLDAKRRREEAWLLEAHPDYDEYRANVRTSFVPFVW
jgi:protein-S-isoprenylcysteine O-methyltransferase Ste14